MDAKTRKTITLLAPILLLAIILATPSTAATQPQQNITGTATITVYEKGVVLRADLDYTQLAAHQPKQEFTIQGSIDRGILDATINAIIREYADLPNATVKIKGEKDRVDFDVTLQGGEEKLTVKGTLHGDFTFKTEITSTPVEQYECTPSIKEQLQEAAQPYVTITHVETRYDSATRTCTVTVEGETILSQLMKLANMLGQEGETQLDIDLSKVDVDLNIFNNATGTSGLAIVKGYVRLPLPRPLKLDDKQVVFYDGAINIKFTDNKLHVELPPILVNNDVRETINTLAAMLQDLVSSGVVSVNEDLWYESEEIAGETPVRIVTGSGVHEMKLKELLEKSARPGACTCTPIKGSPLTPVVPVVRGETTTTTVTATLTHTTAKHAETSTVESTGASTVEAGKERVEKTESGVEETVTSTRYMHTESYTSVRGGKTGLSGFAEDVATFVFGVVIVAVLVYVVKRFT